MRSGEIEDSGKAKKYTAKLWGLLKNEKEAFRRRKSGNICKNRKSERYRLQNEKRKE